MTERERGLVQSRLALVKEHIKGDPTMASVLEEALAQGVKDGKIPHAIVCATNKDGSFQYHHATGLQHYGIDDEPVQEDSLLMIASQSKLLTAVSALKMIELGHIGLDDDVTPHLPELGTKQVLQGFDDSDRPILHDRQNPITLRHLLSHSSGTSYGFDAKMAKYLSLTGGPDAASSLQPTIVERYNTPLSFEPGTSWTYSPGLDWTGLLLQRLTGQTLEEFQTHHFWQPLNLLDRLTFWPTAAHKTQKQPQLVIRPLPSGPLHPFTHPHINTHSTDCFGGHGLYAQLPAYLEILRSLLANDRRLLLPTSVDELFRPQLSPDAERDLRQFLQVAHAGIPGELDPTVPMSYALGGLVFLEDGEGRRRKGTMSWGGLFNTFWTVDREAGVAFTFGTQVLPPGDAGCKEMSGVAERAVYRMAGLG